MKLYLLAGWSAFDTYYSLAVCKTQDEANKRLVKWMEENSIPHPTGAEPIDSVDGYPIIVGVEAVLSIKVIPAELTVTGRDDE